MALTLGDARRDATGTHTRAHTHTRTKDGGREGSGGEGGCNVCCQRRRDAFSKCARNMSNITRARTFVCPCLRVCALLGSRTRAGATMMMMSRRCPPHSNGVCCVSCAPSTHAHRQQLTHTHTYAHNAQRCRSIAPQRGNLSVVAIESSQKARKQQLVVFPRRCTRHTHAPQEYRNNNSRVCVISLRTVGACTFLFG